MSFHEQEEITRLEAVERNLLDQAKRLRNERDEARAQAAALTVAYEKALSMAFIGARASQIDAVVDTARKVAGRPILDALVKAEAALRAARSGLPMILARITYKEAVRSDDDDAIGPAPIESGRGPWECGCGASHAEIEKVPHRADCEWAALNAALAAIQALGIRGGA